MITETAEPVSHLLLGASLAGLGAAVMIVYKNTTSRITRVEKRQDAHLSLLLGVAMKVGVDKQLIKDVQDAIRSGS